MRAFDRDLIRGGHYGQRSCEPHPKAEHMAAPTNAANVKKALANSEPSTHGPSVWSGRASQGKFVDLAVSGLASMYPAFDWSVSLRAIMDISAPAISLADRPQRAIWATSVHKRREDRTSISSQSLADLGMTGVAAPVINYATRSLLASKSRPRANTLHAMRASLLASAIASTLWCSRFLAASSQGLSP